MKKLIDCYMGLKVYISGYVGVDYKRSIADTVVKDF